MRVASVDLVNSLHVAWVYRREQKMLARLC